MSAALAAVAHDPLARVGFGVPPLLPLHGVLARKAQHIPGGTWVAGPPDYPYIGLPPYRIRAGRSFGTGVHGGLGGAKQEIVKNEPNC